jgi:hypothetical protein
MACHFLEELLTRGPVCLLTLHPVSLKEHDRFWGTRLAETDLQVQVLESRFLDFIRLIRLPLVRLEMHLLCRAARKLRSRYTSAL